MDRVSSRKVRTALRSAPRSFGAKFNFAAAGASGPRSTVWSQIIAYGYFTLGLRPVSVWNVLLEVSPLLNSHHVSQIRIKKPSVASVLADFKMLSRKDKVTVMEKAPKCL